MSSDVSRVLDFWYGRPPMEWFFPKDGFDTECTSQFGGLVKQAISGDLDGWAAEPDGSIALLILLDQLTRNVFRKQAAAFSGDTKAAEISTKCIALGFDKKVPILRATQFYMPLMHSESLLAQVAALSLFKELRAKCEEGSPEADYLDKSIWAEGAHLEVILRFGRYPARNAALGRQNTEAEEEFLKEYPQGLPLKRPGSEGK